MKLHTAITFLTATLLLGCSSERITHSKPTAAPVTFELKEVSAFQAAEKVYLLAYARDGGRCTNSPSSEISTYPRLYSTKAFYGTLGREARIPFVIDESGGTGTGYDRLYIDTDSDSDLSDETPLSPLESPPTNAPFKHGADQQVCFSYVSIDVGKGPAEVMPLFASTTNRGAGVSLIMTKTRAGDITIGTNTFEVLLRRMFLTDEYGDLSTQMYLTYHDGKRFDWPRWSGGNWIGSTHRIDDKLYEFSVPPDGGSITVSEYGGKLGTLRTGIKCRLYGARELKAHLSMHVPRVAGALFSTNTAVFLGDEYDDPPGTTSIQLPVGDYAPSMMTFFVGQMEVDISNNYHMPGKPDELKTNNVYSIQIREDKPFTLNLSKKPDVLFVSPAVNSRVKAGDEIEINAVLVNHKMDIMFRRMKRRIKGKRHSYNEYTPRVYITRRDGTTMAEGKMEYG